MSDEARLRAKLGRADARIAELEEQLKTSRTQTQIFANAIADAAIHASILAPEAKDGLDGVQLLHLLENIAEECTRRVIPNEIGKATASGMRGRLALWYPPRAGEAGEKTPAGRPRKVTEPTEIEIDLIDVRAANSIVIDYDFERDGYRIRMSTIFEGIEDEGLVEVGFVPAWVENQEGLEAAK